MAALPQQWVTLLWLLPNSVGTWHFDISILLSPWVKWPMNVGKSVHKSFFLGETKENPSLSRSSRPLSPSLVQGQLLLQIARSQGDEFTSQFTDCRNFGSKFSKLKSSPFKYLLNWSARNRDSEVAVSSSPNRYAVASVLFIPKNIRYTNHTHSKYSLITTLNLFPLHLYFPCQNTHKFLLNTFMHYSSLRARSLLVLCELYKPLRNTLFLLHLLLSFTVSSTVIKFLLCTGHRTALAACCLRKYLG